MTVRYLNPENHLPPQGRYSHVAIAEPGRFAFIAGQVALDAKGELVGPGDVAAQFPQVFRNIGTVLEGIGAGFRDIVELTTYLVGEESRAPWLEARNAVYEQHFGGGPYPPKRSSSSPGWCARRCASRSRRSSACRGEAQAASGEAAAISGMHIPHGS